MSKFARQTVVASPSAFSFGQGIALAMDVSRESARYMIVSAASPAAIGLVEQYDQRKISRTKAFEGLRKVGYSTDDIRAMLGDTDDSAVDADPEDLKTLTQLYSAAAEATDRNVYDHWLKKINELKEKMKGAKAS